MFNKFLNILFPERCPVCAKESLDHDTAPICRECWEAIGPYSGPACQRCGKPLRSEAGSTCGDCLISEPAFSYARSFGLYEGALRKAINHLKYHGVKRLSGPLSDLMLHIDLPRVDAVVPVPLHKKRLRQREFNQSALIARQVAKSLGADLILNCLVKTRDTAPQVGLRSGQRTDNIRRAFSVSDRTLVEDKRIMLIDDVVTTGSTIRECASVLKAGGASTVYVISLAHGVSD